MDSGVIMYSTRLCPYCIRARKLLKSKGIAFTDISVDGRGDLRREMTQLSGRRTVPQVWIGDRHVGGFDDLARLEHQGQLDPLLDSVS